MRGGRETLGGTEMNDNDIRQVIFLFVVVAFGVSLSFAQGYSIGEKSAKKETIVYCVEQPTACKTKYDYFKLLEKK